MARITRAQKEAFLQRLGETGCVKDACLASCISDRYVYRLRARDAGFAQGWRLAELRAKDLLRQEAFRRGVAGWTVPVFYQGKPCGEIRRYSDRMLIELLNLPLSEPSEVEPFGAEADAPAGPSQGSVALGVKALLEVIDGAGRDDREQ